MQLTNHDGIYVLTLNQGENRFNPTFLGGFQVALDEVEEAGAHALVTVGEGKFYSNGLDLDWMAKVPPTETGALISGVHALYKRLLSFPVITVAALNGHAFAAGAMLALAHDFRVMRSDRGFFCLPEVDIKIPFTKMMSAMILARLQKQVAHEAMVTGRRYGAAEAVEKRIADLSAAEAEVLPRALELARQYGGKPSDTLGQIKRVAYQHVLDIPD
jgi:enoyl-CoA hydratase/carnithine racemase